MKKQTGYLTAIIIFQTLLILVPLFVDNRYFNIVEAKAHYQCLRNSYRSFPRTAPVSEVLNALQVGTDSEGGYLVPDEFEHTLIEGLQEENIFRKLAHTINTSSGDRKIPVVATKGSASWVDEEGAFTESDDAFSQGSIGAYKLGTASVIFSHRFLKVHFQWLPIFCPLQR